MATIATVLMWNLALVVGVFLVLWLFSLALRDASIVDPCWGMGFVLVAWHTFLMKTPPGPRGWLLIGLVTMWGVRLSGYLLWRNWGHGEDRRYQTMREKHGDKFWLVSLFTVFLLQAVLLWFISWPVQMGIVFGQQLNLFDFIGAFLCLTGVLFESVGDWQLARFKANSDNAGRVLDTGLWRYTRHPNYFGDFCVWWGLFIIAASGGAWWTALSPLVMSFFLMKVSGVTLLESTIVERRPEYRDYIKRTNAFFPGLPKH